ncbi:anti-sigma factor [Actinomyces trachealis]|uniref:anti-sigma factor n=1 Tax=Actinomyces trachealis TaxID=2763540 RepID=UPI001892B16D|nr:anti-sigma factor [Actinomyces trachealis]
MSTEDKAYDVRQPARADGLLHLAGSGDDAALTAQLEADETLAALGASLRPVQPSPELRARLLAQVSEAAAQEAREAQVVGLSSRRRRLGAVLRVAASVALLATGVGIGRWSTLDALAPTEHFAHLNQAQDVHRVTDTMPDGHIATLTWSEDMSMTALSLPDQMMDAAAGASLQVWLRKGGELRSLGLYDPAKGTGFTFLDLMPEVQAQVFITLEPKGGSVQPTGEPLVTFDVNADGTTSRKPTVQPTTTSQA